MLSQMPAFLKSGLDATLKFTWLLPLAYLTIFNLRNFINRKLYPFYLFIAVFLLYCCLCEGIFGVKYLGPDSYNIGISCMVTAVSFAFWTEYSNPKLMNRLVFCILLCSLVLAMSVYTDFIAGHGIEERTYAYKSKNSLGQVLLAGALIAFVHIPKARLLKILYIIAIIVVLTIMFMLKSRATIVGALFLILYFAIKYKNKRARTLIFFLTICAILVILLNDTVYEIIVNNIFLASRSGEDLDSISSGRMYLISGMINKVDGHLIFGIGQKYLDCFPIIIFIQYGIIGFIIVFLFIAKALNFTFHKVSHNNKIHLTAFLLLMIFLLNSLFEAQPPFGPGVKCFLLWMMFGFSLAESSKYTKLKPIKCL